MHNGLKAEFKTNLADVLGPLYSTSSYELYELVRGRGAAEAVAVRKLFGLGIF